GTLRLRFGLQRRRSRRAPGAARAPTATEAAREGDAERAQEPAQRSRPPVVLPCLHRELLLRVTPVFPHRFSHITALSHTGGANAPRSLRQSSQSFSESFRPIGRRLVIDPAQVPLRRNFPVSARFLQWKVHWKVLSTLRSR